MMVADICINIICIIMLICVVVAIRETFSLQELYDDLVNKNYKLNRIISELTEENARLKREQDNERRTPNL